MGLGKGNRSRANSCCEICLKSFGSASKCMWEQEGVLPATRIPHAKLRCCFISSLHAMSCLLPQLIINWKISIKRFFIAPLFSLHACSITKHCLAFPFSIWIFFCKLWEILVDQHHREKTGNPVIKLLNHGENGQRIPEIFVFLIFSHVN